MAGCGDCLTGGACPGLAQTGYWQYVKTDTYIDFYANQTGGNPAKPYPDTYTGQEGALTVTITFGTSSAFGATFSWSPPPSILIPGTALYWPVSATIVQNVNNNPPYLGFGFTANVYPYASVSDLSNYTGYSSPYLIEIFADNGLSSSNPNGTVLNYNNALLTAPTKIPGSSMADANGYMTILTAVDSSSYSYWSYVYQWVPGSGSGACGGTCTLASSGQSIGVGGGSGTVGITATSTWNAVAVDSWIRLTSSASGTGNSTVTFTVDANTGGSRTGTLIIGAQQYTISQAGSATSTGTTSVTITNPGFETLPSNPNWINCSGTGGVGSGGAGCRDTLDGNIPGWTASSSSTIGLFQPGPNYFTLPLPTAEATTIAQVNNGALSQVLSATLQASIVYTLSVDIGRRLDNLYPSPGPTAQLFAGSTLIASATGTEPPLGGWTTWTGTYTSTATDPLAGQSLKIVLGSPAAQGDFDNVQLTAAPAGGSTTCSYALGATSASEVAAGGTVTATVTAGSLRLDGGE